MQLAVTANLGGPGLVEVGEGASPTAKGKRETQQGGADNALFAALMTCLAAGAAQRQPTTVAVGGKAEAQASGGAADLAGVGSVGATGAVNAPQAKETGQPSPAPGQQAPAAPSTQQPGREVTDLSEGMNPGDGTHPRNAAVQPVRIEEPLPVAPPGPQAMSAADMPEINTENSQRVQPAASPDEAAVSIPLNQPALSSASTEAAVLPHVAPGEPQAETPANPAAPVAESAAPAVALRAAPAAQTVTVAASALPVEARTQPTQSVPIPGNTSTPATPGPARAADQTPRTEPEPALPVAPLQLTVSPAPPGPEALAVTADAVTSPRPVDSPRATPRSSLAPTLRIGPTVAPGRDSGIEAERPVTPVAEAAPVAARRDRKATDDTASVRPQFSGQEATSPDIDALASGERITRAVVQAAQARPTEAGQGATGETVSALHVALDPPGLGTVHVRVETAGDTVRATVTVPNSGVSGALQHLEPQVRAALAEHGLALEHFQLSHQAGQESRDPQADRPEFVATRPRAAAPIERTEQITSRVQASGGLDVVV